MPDEAEKKDFSFPHELLARLMEVSHNNKWINKRRQEVQALFKNCNNTDEASLIMHTLELFQYIDGDKLEEALKKITDIIVNDWKLGPNDTRIVCKDIEGRTDSSAALQQMIKSNFSHYDGWSTNGNFPSNLEKILSNQSVLNVVLVDDFSGTGTSLQKLCIWIAEKCEALRRPPVNVYATFVAAMEATLTATYHQNLKNLYHFMEAKKAISIHFPNNGEVEKAHMINFERNYGNIGRTYSLGYRKSEAIFHAQNLNTPNNVLPIFWQKGSNTTPMFPRLGKNNEKK
ncbi:hypothetical protein ACC703_14915 [Rhizobium ruizarguesonis]|nr:hypothetical protein [Rhizobium leguminosarum bv. viciae]